MRVNGASTYDTRAGSLSPRPWGVTTQEHDSVFVHVLEGVDVVLALRALPRRVLRAALLDGGAPVAISATPPGLTLTLPRGDVSAADQGVVLTLGR
jgi:alpha-L-fucosidase